MRKAGVRFPLSPFSFFLVPVLLSPVVSDPAFIPKPSKIPAADVDRAIKNGVRWLCENARDVPKAFEDVTCDELVLYTLVHGGVAHDDPVFKALLKRVVDREPAKTYSVALAAMCLVELDRAGYQWKLRDYAQFLVDTQCENGQWSYGEPLPPQKKAVATGEAKPAEPVATGPGGRKGGRKADGREAPLHGTRAPLADPSGAKPGGTGAVAKKIPIHRTRRGPPFGDNSNSQYAALGLRACAEAGFDIDPACVRDALKMWQDRQKIDEQTGDPKKPGPILTGPGAEGWGYDWHAENDVPWGSMTVGGIGAVAIYQWMQGKPWKDDARIKKGLDWLLKHWDLNVNPRSEVKGRGEWQYYFLYGIERVGMLVGTDTIGEHDWYDEGAAYLLKHQKADGSWKGRSQPVYDTCFAILFLKRATRALIYTEK